MSLVAPGAPVAERLTLVDCIGSQLARSLAETASVQDVLVSSGRPKHALEAGAGGLNHAFLDILRIPIGEIFKSACLQLAVESPEYESMRQGDVGSMIALPSIAVESSHHPTISVDGAGAAFVLDLTLQLALEIKGAQLLIEDRHVVGAQTGASQGALRITLNGSAQQELRTVEFSLPGQLRFSRPTEIAQ